MPKEAENNFDNDLLEIFKNLEKRIGMQVDLFDKLSNLCWYNLKYNQILLKSKTNEKMNDKKCLNKQSDDYFFSKLTRSKYNKRFIKKT